MANWFISAMVKGDSSQKIDFEAEQWRGYLVMILALSTIFFGVKSYRDKDRNGYISFKDAFVNGLAITFVASVVYVIGWMIFYPNFIPDFADQYAAFEIEQFSELGLSPDEIDTKTKYLLEFNEMYKKPLVMAGFSFLEIFPVGIIIALISAFILKRKTGVN